MPPDLVPVAERSTHLARPLTISTAIRCLQCPPHLIADHCSRSPRPLRVYSATLKTSVMKSSASTPSTTYYSGPCAGQYYATHGVARCRSLGGRRVASNFLVSVDACGPGAEIWRPLFDAQGRPSLRLGRFPTVSEAERMRGRKARNAQRHQRSYTHSTGRHNHRHRVPLFSLLTLVRIRPSPLTPAEYNNLFVH